jgi:hypothetical protein
VELVGQAEPVVLAELLEPEERGERVVPAVLGRQLRRAQMPQLRLVDHEKVLDEMYQDGLPPVNEDCYHEDGLNAHL